MMMLMMTVCSRCCRGGAADWTPARAGGPRGRGGRLGAALLRAAAGRADPDRLQERGAGGKYVTQRHNATLNDLPEPLAGAEVGSTAARACPAGVPTLALAGARSVLLTNLTLALPPSLSSLRCTAAQVLPVTPVGRRERVSIYWSGSLEN